MAREVKNGWELRGLDQDITGPAPVVWRATGQVRRCIRQENDKGAQSCHRTVRLRFMGNRLCVGGQSRAGIVSASVRQVNNGMHPVLVNPVFLEIHDAPLIYGVARCLLTL